MPEIINLKDKKLQAGAPLRCLIYGASGMRKTTLLGTFPEPIKLYDFDHKNKPLYGKDVDIESFNAPSEYGTPESRQTATKIIKDFMTAVKKDKKDPKYKTLALDSISFIDPIVCWYFCDLQGKNNTEPTIEVYGMIRGWYDWLFMELNSSAIGKNVVVIGHEDYDIDKESGVTRILPLITTKIRQKLAAMFEETYYMNTAKGADGKEVYRLHYRTIGKAVAGSQILRTGPGYIDDPSYQKIMQLAGVV